MLDSHLQERFARRCTDAAFGYSAATTAAYAAFADQVFNFWTGVLTTPERQPARRTETLWGWWPMPPAQRELPAMPFQAFMPFAPFGWPAMPTQVASSPFPSSVYGPFAAWLNMFPMTPSAAWPMAFMMMASGVPRSVAWPAAEANAAVMDAAGAAADSVRKVYSSYHTEGGHSGGGRNTWPSAPLFALAFLPLTMGGMMSAMRFG